MTSRKHHDLFAIPCTHAFNVGLMVTAVLWLIRRASLGRMLAEEERALPMRAWRRRRRLEICGLYTDC